VQILALENSGHVAGPREAVGLDAAIDPGEDDPDLRMIDVMPGDEFLRVVVHGNDDVRLPAVDRLARREPHFLLELFLRMTLGVHVEPAHGEMRMLVQHATHADRHFARPRVGQVVALQHQHARLVQVVGNHHRDRGGEEQADQDQAQAIHSNPSIFHQGIEAYTDASLSPLDSQLKRRKLFSS
jgi:hypothetical protein